MIAAGIVLLVIAALILFFGNDPDLRKLGLAAGVIGLGLIVLAVLLDVADEGNELDAALFGPLGLLGRNALRLSPIRARS